MAFNVPAYLTKNEFFLIVLEKYDQMCLQFVRHLVEFRSTLICQKIVSLVFQVIRKTILCRYTKGIERAVRF